MENIGEIINGRCWKRLNNHLVISMYILCVIKGGVECVNLSIEVCGTNKCSSVFYIYCLCTRGIVDSHETRFFGLNLFSFQLVNLLP